MMYVVLLLFGAGLYAAECHMCVVRMLPCIVTNF